MSAKDNIPDIDWSKLVTPQAALHLVVRAGTGFSKFGGCPDVPAAFVWPMRIARSVSGWTDLFGVLWAKIRRRPRPIEPERPLSFLAQIDLSEVAKYASPDYSDCPKQGGLYFFFNEDEWPVGADPCLPETYSWRIIYVEDIRAVSPRSEPLCPDNPIQTDPERHLQFKPITSWPITTESDTALKNADLYDDDQCENYWELTDSVFVDQPKHQLFGFANPIQGHDMAEMCCRNAFRRTPLSDDISSEPKWRLLLQVDSDDYFCWGDCGMLYFWICEDDLAKHDFTRVWLEIQCY